MQAYLKQKMLYPDKVTGLEVTFLPEDQLLIQIVTAVNNKGKISKTNQATVTSIEALIPKMPAGLPVTICFNGKGVLIRKAASLSIEANPIGAVLPNANPDDFYYEVYQPQQAPVMAIVRKTLVDDFIHLLQHKGYRVLQASLGFSAIGTLLPFIKQDGRQVIETNSFTLTSGPEHTITDFSSKEPVTNNSFKLPEYAISDQYIQAPFLLAFAAAVQLLTDDPDNAPVLPSPVLTAARKAFKDTKLFKVAGISLLTVVFVLLLVNFLVYNHYFNLNKEYQVKQLLSLDVREKTTVLQQKIRQREQLLKKTGWGKSNKISLYADRIASLTPTNTLLTSMAIHPVRSNHAGETTGFYFKQDTIQLSGTCGTPVEVNQFINNLKLITEFKAVFIRNYLYKKEEENGTFLIEIITR
jgi:hypothetical protein